MGYLSEDRREVVMVKPPEQVLDITVGTDGPTTAAVELVYIPGHFRVRYSNVDSGDVFLEGYGMTVEDAVREANKGWER